MHRRTTLRRAALSGLAAVGLVALGSTAAMAHVTITPSTTDAGATAVLRVEIPHGCDGSATTAISIRIPQEVTDVSAGGTDRWAVEQTADGLTYTTDESLAADASAEVDLSVRLPDDAGATLVFPVVQKCEEGEAAWTEVAEHGDGHDELDKPAPVIVVTADDAGPAAADGDEQGSAADAEPVSAAAGADERSPLITYGAIGALVAGGLAGGAVLLRHRRRP